MNKENDEQVSRIIITNILILVVGVFNAIIGLTIVIFLNSKESKETVEYRPIYYYRPIEFWDKETTSKIAKSLMEDKIALEKAIEEYVKTSNVEQLTKIGIEPKNVFKNQLPTTNNSR